MLTRQENDFLGTVEIPVDALYGIHSVRAIQNFPTEKKIHVEWYKAISVVKQACYYTYSRYKQAVQSKYNNTSDYRFFSDSVLQLLIASAKEMAQGKYFDHFIVPAISGGAGTSFNMNINEIVSNVALVKQGEAPGTYRLIDPIQQANVFQSTNDVIPSSLKVALMRLLLELEENINLLRSSIENIEKAGHEYIRPGYTQLQEAVPTTFGRFFSSFNDAFSRDWWRISKCLERMKQLNLGGSAIGTSLTVPRFFVFEVIPALRELTSLPLAKAENLSDATANLDAFVEVHGMLKAHAVNNEKLASDLRLLSSDIMGTPALNIPEKQTGSSVMPGKVNPVISEFVISNAHKVYANDMLVTQLSAQGQLELNAYLPTIGDALIESVKLLIASNKSLTLNLINGIKINHQSAYQKTLMSPSITAALIPLVGYNKATEIARHMKNKQVDIFIACHELNILNREKISAVLSPHNLLQEGYILNDLLDG